MAAPLCSSQGPLRTIDVRGKLPAGIFFACLLVSCLSLTSCNRKTAAPAQQSRTVAPALPATAPSPGPAEQSCRAFVQNFYDWYWNRFAESANSVAFDMHTLPTVDTVLKRKPPVLSPELSKLIADDEKTMLATHEIGKLDFDPFWGNQDPQGIYKAGRAAVEGDRCKVSIPEADEIVELQRSGTSWVFVNFYYCFAAYDSTLGRHCPDSDLVQILKQ